MGVHLGFRRTNPIQCYADDILQMVPERKKAELVARALYSYFGGKQLSEDDLHIMLTGRPASSPSSVAPRADNIPSAKRSKPQRAKVKKVETPKPEKEDETPSLYNKEDTRNPAGKMEPQIDNQDMKEQPRSDDGGYQFSGEDDAMLHDAMAAFMNL